MSLLDVSKDSPFSNSFKLPPGKNSKDLMRLLLGEQKKLYGKTIIDVSSALDYKILRRNLGFLIKEYSIEDVKRGILMAAQVSDHPFSTKLIKEQIEWRLAQLNSPVLTSIPSIKVSE